MNKADKIKTFKKVNSLVRTSGPVNAEIDALFWKTGFDFSKSKEKI